jgi:hypothetical protein
MEGFCDCIVVDRGRKKTHPETSSVRLFWDEFLFCFNQCFVTVDNVIVI